MNLDLVSDLHIDHWGTPHQFDWLHTQQSDTLVVAGDTSDSIDLSCSYLDKLCDYYKTVLVIDGNHEHQTRMNDLTHSIESWLTSIAQTRAVCLTLEQPVINNIQFVGCCGWWSFDFGSPNISRAQSMQTGIAVAGLTPHIISLQEQQSLLDAHFLTGCVVGANLDHSIHKVVVVTHTLPHPSCISWMRYPQEADMVGCYGNTRFNHALSSDLYNKITTWLFGHNHDHKDIPYKYMRFTSNPRGRRCDWNRTTYSVKTISI